MNPEEPGKPGATEAGLKIWPDRGVAAATQSGTVEDLERECQGASETDQDLISVDLGLT